jgi:hypothetical protein
MPRYLSMVRIDEAAIGDRVPSAALMERMGGLMEEMKSAGVLVDTAGPSAHRGRKTPALEPRPGLDDRRAVPETRRPSGYASSARDLAEDQWTSGFRSRR